MVIRIRYKKEGGHYVCRVFTQLPRQEAGGTFARVGDLVFDEEDFNHLQNHFNKIEVLADDATEVEFRVATR